MPETPEPVEWEHKTPGTINSPVPRGRRHKRKRGLSVRRKRVRFFALLYAIILLALFLGLMWWLNRTG
jgi:4-hydroxybenzoate polyprenyltransferase